MFEKIKALVASQFPSAIKGEKQEAWPSILTIDEKDLVQVCQFLHEHQETYFDSLSCITGIDNGVESGTMEVIYTLYSIPYDIQLSVSVVLDRENPSVDSLCSIWRGANWHEREAYDLLGILFNNHPDLRRILLPNDWEGYPLRKDYEEQEMYHGIKVKY